MQSPKHLPSAQTQIARFHPDTVSEVAQAVSKERVVVVGMGWNPHVKRARKALDAAGIAYTYLGYGNYLSGWRKRLAIKVWAGWPTFPQTYVNGELLGGANETQAAIASGELTAS